MKKTTVLQERILIWHIPFLPQKDVVHLSPFTEFCGSEG